MLAPSPPKRLRDFTKIPLEILVIVLSLGPIVLLIFFYPTLPSKIPVFLNFSGDVEVWADKSAISVFRVPLMAIDLQLIFLLMKYATLQYSSGSPGTAAYESRLAAYGVGIWDWLRCFNAIKMSAESLDILFMSEERLHFLRTPAWAVVWIAVILGVVGALVYAYRLLAVKREMKKTIGDGLVEKQAHRNHVYARIFYYNPSDAAVFVDKYGVNFGNKWSYALLACVAAYPLLVFSTSLIGQGG